MAPYSLSPGSAFRQFPSGRIFRVERRQEGARCFHSRSFRSCHVQAPRFSHARDDTRSYSGQCMGGDDPSSKIKRSARHAATGLPQTGGAEGVFTAPSGTKVFCGSQALSALRVYQGGVPMASLRGPFPVSISGPQRKRPDDPPARDRDERPIQWHTSARRPSYIALRSVRV
jgi:hypothetical protein